MSAVTVELDCGPVDMRFTFTPVGDPMFSDVPAEGPRCDTEQEAVLYGARLLALGNWRSFVIEKRYERRTIHVESEDDDEQAWWDRTHTWGP